MARSGRAGPGQRGPRAVVDAGAGGPLLEVRVYSLVPGCAEKFDALVRLRSAPLLAEFGIAVVAYGPLEDDGYDGYYLARVFADADARERQESAFYGSRVWRDELRARGPPPHRELPHGRRAPRGCAPCAASCRSSERLSSAALVAGDP